MNGTIARADRQAGAKQPGDVRRAGDEAGRIANCIGRCDPQPGREIAHGDRQAAVQPARRERRSSELTGTGRAVRPSPAAQTQRDAQGEPPRRGIGGNFGHGSGGMIAGGTTGLKMNTICYKALVEAWCLQEYACRGMAGFAYGGPRQ